jgi:hypothetical protein
MVLMSEPDEQEGASQSQEEDFVELPLLLPARQLEALERDAALLGLTVGQLLRWVVRSYVAAERRRR